MLTFIRSRFSSRQTDCCAYDSCRIHPSRIVVLRWHIRLPCLDSIDSTNSAAAAPMTTTPDIPEESFVIRWQIRLPVRASVEGQRVECIHDRTLIDTIFDGVSINENTFFQHATNTSQIRFEKLPVSFPAVFVTRLKQNVFAMPTALLIDDEQAGSIFANFGVATPARETVLFHDSWPPFFLFVPVVGDS